MSRKTLINPLERAVSTDINRLQSFRVKDEADVLRYLLDALAHDNNAAGDAHAGDVAAAPMRATVIAGLTVRPDIGTVDCLVDPGVLVAVNPFGGDTTDDSILKVVSDGGVPGTGVLQLTVNSSGQVRIDVVECAIVPANVDETDSRDIFSPTTGVFSAVTLTKVTRDILQYRIRTGTPGGGYPGNLSGWLPLAVVKVPDGSLTWDDCTLWDVRPLAADRVKRPHNVAIGTPAVQHKQSAYTSFDTAGPPHNMFLDGFVEVEAPDGYILGGDFSARTGEPLLIGTVTTPAYPEGGWSGINNRPWYIYLAAPFGLPRWAEYTPASSFSRVPASPRGLLVFGQADPPKGRTGVPTGALTLPSVYGLGGATSNARLVMAGYYTTNFIHRVSMHGGDTVLPGTPTLNLTATTFTCPNNNTINVTYTLTAGTHFPATAGKLRVRLKVAVTVTLGSTCTITRTARLFDVGGVNAGWVEIRRFRDIVMAPIGYEQWDEFEMTIPQTYVSGTDYKFEVNYDLTNNGLAHDDTTPDSTSLAILGWSLF